jgi:iron(III) transport system substrate-binding protein
MNLDRRALAAAIATLGATGPLRTAAAQVRAPVRVFATTDRPVVQSLIDDFERRHPLLRVDYHELGSAELFERVQAARTAGSEGPDVVWSSAMDLQIKLVNDGHAARHVSPHATGLPRWAVWKHEAYGTGPEPVGMVVRSELAPVADLPRTHAA